MELKQTSCPSCSGPVHVPPGADRVTCGYCGSALSVELSNNEIELSVAKELGKALQDVGQTTSRSIQEGATVTRAELQRLQIGQQISSLQIQQSSIRAEIRSLERERKLTRQAKRQLKELRSEERQVYDQIRRLQAALNPKPATQAGSSAAQSYQRAQTTSSGASTPMKRGCLLGCLTYIVLGVVCGMIAIPLDSAIFGVASGEASSGAPFFTIAAFGSFIAGVLVFVYVTAPNASIWKKLPAPVIRLLSAIAPAKGTTGS